MPQNKLGRCFPPFALLLESQSIDRRKEVYLSTFWTAGPKGDESFAERRGGKTSYLYSSVDNNAAVSHHAKTCRAYQNKSFLSL